MPPPLVLTNAPAAGIDVHATNPFVAVPPADVPADRTNPAPTGFTVVY